MDFADDSSESLYDDEQIQAVFDRLDTMSETVRDIVLDFYIDGYSVKEISAKTGRKPRTIESIIYRTVKYLRKIFVHRKQL
jgi:RNA polymerase sigma-70 factor (ECF subfamily)